MAIKKEPVIVGTHAGPRDLMNPSPCDFTIHIVARSLANKCRYNGLTRTFYSVAEHCVRASMICADPLLALLHELDEVYLPELMTPLKRILPDWWHDMALRHMKAGAEAFGLPELIQNDRLPESVIDVDNILLMTEFRDLEVQWPDCVPKPDYEALEKNIYPWPPELAEDLFISRYETLVKS
jgi:hypothetical protein